MTNHIADDHAALLDYLYEEGEPAERLKIARHLQECAACTVTALELQSVRGMLSDWAPPPVSLGFRVGNADAGGRPQHLPELSGLPALPAWRTAARRRPLAQAAGALLLFVAGVAASQVNVDYRDGALTLSLHPSPASRPPVQSAATSAATATPAATAAEAQGAKAQVVSVPTPAVGDQAQSVSPPLDRAEQNHAELLQRVKAMIEQSEGRQQRELAIRVSDVIRDFDNQRRADLMRVQENLGQIEGQIGTEVGGQQYRVLTSGAGR